MLANNQVIYKKITQSGPTGFTLRMQGSSKTGLEFQFM